MHSAKEPKVLLIDDCATMCILGEALFKKYGLGTTVVNTGQGALEFLLADDSPLHCVVVLDVNMPKIGGLLVLKVLKDSQKWSKVPVVLVSGSITVGEGDNPKDIRSKAKKRIALLALGADAVAPKPLTSVEFDNAFTRVLNDSGFSFNKVAEGGGGGEDQGGEVGGVEGEGKDEGAAKSKDSGGGRDEMRPAEPTG